MKVVLDTNILVSASFWKGDSSQIIKLIESNNIELVLSYELIEEYNEVIRRDEIIKKIDNKDLILDNTIKKIISLSTIVNPSKKIQIVKEDPDDDKVIECASEGKVDYIITKDNHLLKLKEFEGIKILTTKEFLEIISKD